jgi:hypothetical protein
MCAPLSSVAARKIPEYDASRDRHCPFTQSVKFKTQAARQAELDKRRRDARERGAVIMAGGVHGNDPGRTRPHSPITAATAGPRSASAAAGSGAGSSSGGGTCVFLLSP